MDILDYLLDAYRRGSNLVAPNDADVKLRRQAAPGMLSMTPVAGDAMSGYDAVQSARKGNYGEAALNAVGLLPFVPAMGGTIKSISPQITKALGTDEPAVLASKVKGLLTVQIGRQKSLSERLVREDIPDADKVRLNTDLIKTDENIKKLHGWLTELEPPINHSNPF